MSQLGSNLQKTFAMINNSANQETVIGMLSDKLGAHMPSSAWAGWKGCKFAQDIGHTPSRAIKVRKDFFDALQIDLSTRLVYPVQAFTLLVLDICIKHKLEFADLTGFSVEQSPKDCNYIIGVLVMLCTYLKLASPVLEGIARTMRQSIVNTDMSKALEIGPNVSASSIVDSYFGKKKEELKHPKHGPINAETFPDAEHKAMQPYVDSISTLKTVITNKRYNEYLEKTVRSQIGNKKAQIIGKHLGIHNEICAKRQEMEGEREVQGFTQEHYDYDEVITVQRVTPDATAYALVNDINSASLLDLLKNARVVFKLKAMQCIIDDAIAIEMVRLQEVADKEKEKAKNVLGYGN